MAPETAMLIPLLLLVLIGVVALLSQLIPFLQKHENRRGRLRQVRAHLDQNASEIDNALVLYRLRHGSTSERVKALLKWIDLESPRLEGEDAGLLLGAQEATLKELNDVQNGGR